MWEIVCDSTHRQTSRAEVDDAADGRRGLRSLVALSSAGETEGESRSGPIFVGIRP